MDKRPTIIDVATQVVASRSLTSAPGSSPVGTQSGSGGTVGWSDRSAGITMRTSTHGPQL